MIQTPRIAYRARGDATPEAEISVLASIYKLAISSHTRKEATRPGSPDDAERSLSDGAREIIQDTK
jgi:hypothetical protein